MRVQCWLYLIISVGMCPLYLIAQVSKAGSGHTLDFNGSDDHVVISNPNWTNLNEFSAELWFSIDQYNSDGRNYLIDTRGDGANNNNSFALFIDSANSSATDKDVSFYIDWPSGGHTELEVQILPDTDEWHHLAVTRDGTTMKVYLDGVRCPTTNVGNVGPKTDLIDITSSWRIATFAKAGVGGNYWTNGRIDEIRIWNKALTKTEIREHMSQQLQGSEANLIGYWRVDEGQSSTVYDYSPGNHDGTLQ